MAETVSNRMKYLALFAGLALALSIFTMDYLTDYEICFSIFYLGPIALWTWYLDRKSGVALSALSALAWLVADLKSGDYSHQLFVPYWNASVRLGFFLVFVLILAPLKEAYAREHRMARADFLTGLANLKAFFEKAEYEVERLKRYASPLTVAFLDLDNFKSINDKFGHQTGDKLLIAVAQIIKDNIRATDTAARIGGDEFLVLLPQTDEGSAREMLDRLQEELIRVMRQNGWPVTPSTGVVTYLNPPSSVEEMVQKADWAMYAVKNNGKNAINCRRSS
jgi:diguanylate cyclase (GGDEF)-like protein